MHTLLPYSDFRECAKVLDSTRLNSQINEGLVILRSIAKVYDINPRTALSGWEGHTVAKLWIRHELQLARFLKELAEERLLNRPLSRDAAASLTGRKERYSQLIALIEWMEATGFPDRKPALVGDEEFHSGFRALLLLKDIQNETFNKWKHGEYPDHICTRSLLPKKASWKRIDYEKIWEFYGRPESPWYSQWNWIEEPDDTLFFYNADRKSQMVKEIARKLEKPFLPFYKTRQ